MEKHFRILGYLFLVFAALTVVLVLIIAFQPELIRARAPAPGTATIGILLSLIPAIFYAVTGWALLTRKDWSRTIAIAGSVVALFNFPLGTALGIYGLWVTLSEKGRAQFPTYVHPAQA